jgi:hypothetical protein
MRGTDFEKPPRCLPSLAADWYARHGHELMRLKSSVREPRYSLLRITKVLAEGKGITVRWCLKEAGVQSCELTNRNVIKGRAFG